MKKIWVLIILLLCNVNAHPIVDGIIVFYNRKIITFQKEEVVLTVNLNHIMTGNDNVIYQYIRSYHRNGCYYFLFFAKSLWKHFPIGRGEWDSGEIHTVFIIKINEDFNQYEIINQYLAQFEPREYMFTSDGFKRNGTIFYWFIMGHYRGKTASEIFGPEIYRIISVDASKLENGFIINEYQNFDLLLDSWRMIIGNEIYPN